MSSNTVDDCKTAALNRIPSIQRYGVLVAIDRRSGVIFCCSENLQELTGIEARQALDKHWSTLFERSDIPALFDETAGDEAVHEVRRRQMNGSSVLILSHAIGDDTVVEIEPHISSTHFGSRDRIAFMKEISQCSGPEAAAGHLLDSVARITGFDRVMLYKFLPGYHGEVIDERTKPGVRGFLGLRFPESDIPANARSLYTQNLQRSIADTAAGAADLVACADREPPDLRHSHLRAVHPAHIKYLNNIGARASFSVSILSGDKLWGMVACHNAEPTTLSFEQRIVCEELGRILSMRVTDLDAMGFKTHRLAMQLRLTRLLEALDPREDVVESLGGRLGRVRSVFGADGAWLGVGEADFHDGRVPEPAGIDALKTFLAKLDVDGVYGTSRLPEALGHAGDAIRDLCGMLLIPFHGTACLALFRKEQVETVKWAGKPPDIDEALESANAFTPRSSFVAWARQTKGESEPWSDAELSMADEFRDDLASVLEKQHLAHQARLDGLTRVLNKTAFDEQLSRVVGEAGAGEGMFALLMVDLDKFKPVNDSFGHAAGDAILTRVARRLNRVVREGDAVARLGGDEFALIQRGIRTGDDACVIADRVVTELARVFEVEGHDIRISASVGIALFPAHGSEPKALLQQADAALYRIKRAGGNAFALAD